MSRVLDMKSVEKTELEKIGKDLLLKIEPKYGTMQQPKYIEMYSLMNNTLVLPFAYNSGLARPSREQLAVRNFEFSGVLREPQVVVKNEAIKALNSTGSVMVACYPGFGKTCLAIHIASKIKMKTLILCHRIVLIKQWEKAINTFAKEATIQVINSNSVKKNVDFYIVNPSIVSKKGVEFFKDIGFVVCDEAHLIMAEKVSECMKYLYPRYLLGLSATPYRTDGLNALLDLYFGKIKIERKLYRPHIVYKISTGIKPDVKLNKMGKVDWGSVIDSQSNNVSRNEMIIKVIKRFPENVFLVLCKRVSQANYLIQRLNMEKESVTSLVGLNQEYEQKSRILVGTVGKTGVGFDHPRLNSLILAADVENYFIQYLGRVFRRQDTVPVIFDIVDNFGLLGKHFNTRKQVYIEHGGEIKDFKLE